MIDKIAHLSLMLLDSHTPECLIKASHPSFSSMFGELQRIESALLSYFPAALHILSSALSLPSLATRSAKVFSTMHRVSMGDQRVSTLFYKALIF